MQSLELGQEYSVKAKMVVYIIYDNSNTKVYVFYFDQFIAHRKYTIFIYGLRVIQDLTIKSHEFTHHVTLVVKDCAIAQINQVHNKEKHIVEARRCTHSV